MSRAEQSVAAWPMTMPTSAYHDAVVWHAGHFPKVHCPEVAVVADSRKSKESILGYVTDRDIGFGNRRDL